MVTSLQHSREAERLASLRSYHLLDTGPDAALDALAAAARRALSTPTAVITLLDQDRLWFKSAVGLSEMIGYELHQIPRELSFCTHVRPGQVMVVPDASTDARFASSPLITGPEQLRFYAGAPLIGRDGLPLGTLCVLDVQPRDLEPEAVQVLAQMAGAVAELLELRRVEAGANLGSQQVLADSHRLRAGIDAGEMVLHYQPVLDLPSRRWLGVEALVRWAHPGRGLLPPGAFLPLAEASGLIVPLGRQVLTLACTQVALWRAQLPAAADLHVAVNVSGRQLSEPDIVDVVAEALVISGLPPEALVLELTETSVAGVGADVDVALQRIRRLGVVLALDDFGTGYASFSYLQRFQPDIVKIDRCFVAALGRSARDDLLAHSLIGLGLQLGCDVVAEGVETIEQVQALAAAGVRNVQGYFFSTPRSPEDVAEQVLAARS